MKTKQELEAKLDALEAGACVLARMNTFVKNPAGKWNVTYALGQKPTTRDTVVDMMLEAQERNRRWTIYSEAGEEVG